VPSSRRLRRLNVILVRAVTIIPMTRITTVSQGCFTEGTKREHRVILSQGRHAGLTTKPKPAHDAFETRILERFAS
jgi:hypothetical protein